MFLILRLKQKKITSKHRESHSSKNNQTTTGLIFANGEHQYTVKVNIQKKREYFNSVEDKYGSIVKGQLQKSQCPSVILNNEHTSIPL